MPGTAGSTIQCWSASRGARGCRGFWHGSRPPFSVFADRAGRVIALKVGELHRDDADLILDRMRDLDRDA